MTQTIVAIHGYGFDPRSWNPVELAFDGYHLIYLSLPGFGSPAPEKPYSIESLANRFWSELTPHTSVHLIGHSMGGYVCMEMVAQQPSRVASLALVHSHVFADPPEKKAQRTATMQEIGSMGRQPLVNKMIPNLFANPERFPALVRALIQRGLGYADATWLYGTQAMRDRMDHSETLRSIRVPVLMLAGELDRAVPPSLIYDQASLPGQNSLHVYPDVGHMAMYENTAFMIGDLIGFYAGL